MIEHLDYLDSAIEDRTKRIATLEHDLTIVRAELRAYVDIRNRLLGSTERAAKRAPLRADSAGSDDPVQRRKIGRLSHALVTAAVRAYPGTLGTDEALVLAARAMGEDVPRNNVRSSLWSNAKAELLERIADGVFRATEKGANLIGERLGVTANHTNGVNAATQTEGEAERVEGDQGRVEADLLQGAGEPTSD